MTALDFGRSCHGTESASSVLWNGRGAARMWIGKRMTALVGSAPDCARVALHLRHGRVRIARFDASPDSLDMLRNAVRAGAVANVIAVARDPATEGRIREMLGPLDLDVDLCLSPMDAAEPPRRAFGILPVRPISVRPIPVWGRALKDATDRLLAAALLVLLLPLLAALALAIRLDSTGPVFFRQWREGRNGVPFRMLKFRTMRWPAGPLRQAVREDSRVTPVGGALRRTSLDELPQLVNVLLGEMSLVGPRPHAVAMRTAGRPCIDIAPDYPWRHRVKPGMTGLAQMAGLRGGLSSPDELTARLTLDLAYISEWSPLLDLKLMLLTPWRLIFARGAAF